MNFLRQPKVIVLLVLVAVGVYAWPSLKTRWTKYRAAQAAPGQPAVPAENPAGTAVTDEDVVPVFPGVDIDRNYAASNLDGWVTAPRRDPFWQDQPPPPPEVLTHLNLKAIWRQNGLSVAAIDRSICRPGDTIGGYRVVSIDDHGVTLESDGQQTLLQFSTLKPASRGTASPPAARMAAKRLPAPRHPAATPEGTNAAAADSSATGQATSALLKATSQEAAEIDAVMKAAHE